MRYLCLVYVDRDIVGKLTPARDKRLQVESAAYDDELKNRGHLVTADALAEPETAVTVRKRNGKVTTHDGPFAETKEHLGGFLLIEARDLNEAISIAEKDPMAEMGSIEVRAIHDYRSSLGA
jgi:hypothetical protein